MHQPRRKQPNLLTLGLLAGSLASPWIACAQAQPDDTRRIERQLRTAEGNEDYRLRTDTKLSLQERTQLDVGGSLSFTGLWVNDSSDNSTRLLQPEVVLYARASIDGAHQFFARARFVYRTFSDRDSFDGRGDRWIEPFPDRYWYEFDARKALAAYQGERVDWNLNLRIGRQFVNWGSGIALSETLYAVTPTIEFDRRWRLEGLAGITPDHTTDFDTSRWDYDERTRRAFFGGRVVYTFEGGSELYAYGLSMVDYYNENRLRPPLTPLGRTEFKYDSWYVGIGASGSIGINWTYDLEGIYQNGKSWSDPLRGAQRREDISAAAGKANLAYLFRDEGLSRVEAEVLFATGDSDRNSASSTSGGNLRGTSDHQFNALGYANTGLAFAPSLSNLVTLRLGGSTFPFRTSETFEGLQVGIDGLIFTKFNRQGPIDGLSTDRRFLGGEIDVFANWRLTSDLSMTARYGIFLPSAGTAGGKNARHFVLVGVTLGF